MALALTHPRLIDQIVEVPPVKGWKLQRLLQRRARSSKAFVGEAAWSHQSALATKLGVASVIALVPEIGGGPILTRDCKQVAQLHLARLMPTTAILANGI